MTTHQNSTKPMKVVGTSPVRPDGIQKVTGVAQYGADYSLPGMLWSQILRSPHAHAKIRSINVEKHWRCQVSKPSLLARTFLTTSLTT